MVNELRLDDGDLVSVDYSGVQQQILRVLQSQNPFAVSANGGILTINVDEIAAAVAMSRAQSPLSDTKGVRSATVNFSPGFQKSFSPQVQDIKACLERHLYSLLPEGDIEEFVNSLTADLTSFEGNGQSLGLSYPFGKVFGGLETQELTIGGDKPGSNYLLKFHKLTITVGNVNHFQEQLKKGLENHIDNYFDTEDEDDLETVYNLLENQIGNPNSEFNKLQNLVDTETLGKLKKEAKIVYLEHLLNNIETKDGLGVIYLRVLIRRLRLIEEYISSKASGELEVYYAGATVNYQEVFARAETFDALPVIPIIAGILGESTDVSEDKTQFVLGLKMKLNGPVQSSKSETVFEYNLGIINPGSDEHKQELAGDSDRRERFARKVLIRVFLYYFVFASRCNPRAKNYDPNLELEYDPIPGFEEKVLPILRGKDEEAKRQLFRGFNRGLEQFNVQSKIKTLCDLLKNFLKRQTILPAETYNRQIIVSKEILTKDSDRIFNGSFFKDELGENPKKCLRHISMGETAVDETALCQLPASIKIEDVRCYQGKSTARFRFEYDIKEIKALPMLLIPNTNPCWQYYQRSFEKRYRHVLFPYDNGRLNPDGLKANEAFIYRFVWTLLSYLCLYLLLEESGINSLFVPMVRLHEGTKQTPFPAEKFLAHLSKVLCHLFSQNNRCNSQGFRVPPNSFTIGNGLTSLYSMLPKQFNLLGSSPLTLEKLAIIVVSSEESDGCFSNKNKGGKIGSLIGEVFSVEKLNNGGVKIELLETFSANYKLRDLFYEPTVLTEETMNYLSKKEYKHILYVARAPHTSTLHITQTDEDEKLYFMSPSIMAAMKKNREHLKIYPIFFDKYYVRKSPNFKSQSLCVRDTEQLTNVAEDSTQKSAVFFNLFNGLRVGKDEDRFYNGVISYSTLLGNYYETVMEDKDIRQGLLYDSPLKNDILQYLTFFHFYRFEKDRQISLKLDPYENIIGEDGVGNLSLFPQTTAGINFNSLAFLIEVGKVLIDF